MGLRVVQANLKARDDAALGRFWAEALGWTARSVPGATSVAPVGFVWTDPEAPVCVDVIAVPDVATVSYGVHLELASTSAAHQAELVARLTGLGATPVDAGPGEVPWPVLADPEGNVFCVLEPRESYGDTGPIAAIVFDCTQPRAMAEFWSGALDWTPLEVTDGHARLRSVTGVGPFVEFVSTPHLKDVRHRVHLDVVPDRGSDQATEVERLRRLGAKPAAGQGDFSWVVLTDPEGNEFCVLAPG